MILLPNLWTFKLKHANPQFKVVSSFEEASLKDKNNFEAFMRRNEQKFEQ